MPNLSRGSLCECGCGQPVKQGNRFIQFHIAKVMVLARGPRSPDSDETKRRRSNSLKRTNQVKREVIPKANPTPCACGCGRMTTLAKKTAKAKGVIKGQPNKYIYNHHVRLTTPEYVEDPTTGCWVWQRQMGKFGYGHICVNGRTIRAHRAYYRQYKGEIPPNHEIDHLCHSADKTCQGGNTCAHRRCVNPTHLEAVTHLENMRRGRNAKLTEEQITKIQHLRITKRMSTESIAIQFHISPQYVSKLTAHLTSRFRIDS